jgi:hypothetical protein
MPLKQLDHTLEKRVMPKLVKLERYEKRAAAPMRSGA